MCLADYAKHCQIDVYFDPRRPPRPQECIESMWAEINMLKEKTLVVTATAAVRLATVTTVYRIYTIAAVAVMFCVQGDNRHEHKNTAE